jgi:hypothetical protein
MVTGDLESQDSNDGGANGSSLVATTILHPMVRDLAFSALNKAENCVLKQATALKRDADTEFRNKLCCLACRPRKELGSSNQLKFKSPKPQQPRSYMANTVLFSMLAPLLMYLLISLLSTAPMEDMLGLLTLAWMPKEEQW